MMAEYVKYTRGDLAHYIHKHLVPKFTTEENISMDEVRPSTVMQFSDFVVDTASNTFIKCRQSIQDVIEAAHTVEPLKASAEAVAQSVENLRAEMATRLAKGHLSQAEQVILMKLNSCLYKEYPHKEHKGV